MKELKRNTYYFGEIIYLNCNISAMLVAIIKLK
jgi:hypothetical protein